MNRPPIRSMLVVGGGIVGMSAALAFSRAFPAIRVSLLRTPDDPASLSDHFPATLPTVGRFHSAIGLNELDLVRRGIAVHDLGMRFTRPDGGIWLRTHGKVGRDEGPIPFHLIWLAARRNGMMLDYSAFSAASVIGSAGKFVHPSGDPKSPLSSYLYALRLNPARYRALLLDATEALPSTEGLIDSVERGTGGLVEAIHLADGTRMSADMYIDCSGPAASVIGSISPAFDDWSRWMPHGNVTYAFSADDRTLPLAEVGATSDGWRLEATVPGATCTATLSSEATDMSLPIRPGRRSPSFVGNVLAIGDSAVVVDPLQGANLALAQNAILRAIALLPGRDFHALELDEYNRLTRLETDRARDFHALFHADSAGDVDPPPTLGRTLAQWEARGRLPFFEEELYTETDWAQMLIGLGRLPDDIAPVARAVDGGAASAAMTSLARDLNALAAGLPLYPDYLARMRAAPVR